MPHECIYCKKPTTGREGIAHVFPEGLHQNELVLPAGAVCGPCNGYLGRRLDESLIAAPMTAFAIQFLGTPGKKGRPRRKVGAVERDGSEADAAIRTVMNIKRREMSSAKRERLVVEVVEPTGFDILKFRRAIHHVAFNVLASQAGLEYVLRPELDAAREYIKNPRPKDLSWGIAWLCPDAGQLPRALQGLRWESGRRELVGLQVFQMMYTVDLRNTMELEEVATEHGFRFLRPDERAMPKLEFTIDAEGT